MKRIIFLLSFILGVSTTAEAMGLQTYFAKVLIENLNIGGTYSTQKLANLPLSVKNTGEEEINLKIETIIPTQNELDEGYEPIPDTSWVGIEKDTFFSIKPEDMAVTDVIITIPNDKKYLGKKFMAFIWSHTFVEQGIGVGVGLKSKLLLTISQEIPQKEEKESKKQKGGGLSVEPATLHLKNVPIGKIYKLKDNLRILNNTNATQTYTIKPIKPSSIGAKWAEGYYEIPEPAWFSFEKEEVEISPNNYTDVEMYLNIPDVDKYYNQHWVISLDVTCKPKKGEFVALALYPRYLIETEKRGQ